MDTKNTILRCALDLFSVKGYEAVSTREIAEAVGVQKGALYHHFKNKQDIFDNIVAMVEEHAASLNKEMKAPNIMEESADFSYQSMSKDDLIELSCMMFKAYMSDDIIMKFRRMYAIEQYRSEEIAARYNQFFIDSMLDRVANMNKELMDRGVYKQADPKVVAVQYFAPMYMLIQRYDSKPEQLEQALEILKAHLSLFLDQFLV